MKLITRQQLANEAAERWKSQYYRDGKWLSLDNAEGTYSKLVALGPTPSPNAVDSVVGNDTWTHELCDSCAEKAGEFIAIDQSFEDDTLAICRNCAEMIVGLFADGEGE